MSFSEINASSGPLFDRLQILKLNDIFQLQVASFVYECTNNIAPAYFRNYFTKINTIHRINTRQSMKNDLYAVSCNTTQYGLRSIHYSGVRLWNSLPMEIHGSQLRAFSREHSTQPLPRRQGSDRNKLHGARSLFKFLLLKI